MLESHELPTWLEPVAGVHGTFQVDPDLAYPYILNKMGFSNYTPSGADAPTKYDMEVAYGLMKRLARWYAQKHPHGQDPGTKLPRGVRLLIVGHSGRKQRWAIKNFPDGDKPDISAPHMAGHRGRAVIPLWRKLMGPWLDLK